MERFGGLLWGFVAILLVIALLLWIIPQLAGR